MAIWWILGVVVAGLIGVMIGGAAGDAKRADLRARVIYLEGELQKAQQNEERLEDALHEEKHLNGLSANHCRELNQRLKQFTVPRDSHGRFVCRKAAEVVKGSEDRDDD